MKSNQKQHRFMLVVKDAPTMRAAARAVLVTFASRQPDGCSFHLRRLPPPPFKRGLKR